MGLHSSKLIAMTNFYPQQYASDSKQRLNHNYLSQQFSDADDIFQEIRKVVIRNDFTLGSAVDELENLIAVETSSKFAVGVGSGTDALFLSLKALGIGHGDEVITTPYTFYATVGAIVTAGATPVFCDVNSDYNINPSEIEKNISSRTKAIIPVHWAGKPCQMDLINSIAESNNIFVIEDACHAIQALYNNKPCGSFGTSGCFSFHPLKNLNVWGDGGIIVTSDEELASRLRLLRNHGLKDRNTCVEFAYNSRLDTVQAVIAIYVLKNKLSNITSSRISNALLLNTLLSKIPNVDIVEESKNSKEVFHLYQFSTEHQESLYAYLKSKGIDCKIHYPIPMHLQPAASYLGYNYGDFPVAEMLAKKTLSLPVHEFITHDDVYYMAECVKTFCSKL